MRKNKKNEAEKKSWETLYRNGDTREDKGQYNLFRLYKDLGVLRSMEQLQAYCENPDNQEEITERNVSYPHPPCHILQMERQIPLG